MIVYWAPLFHFYQPPTQTRDILAKVSRESYGPMLEVIESYPRAKATVNINGVLTEMLSECGQTEVINKLRELAQGGQVEFTGSAMYHPVLPLIPAEEVDRQMRRNQRANRDAIGDLYQPRGFFPPEMCYSRDILEPIMEGRHDWVIAAGVACPAAWPTNVVYEVGTESDKIAIFFRDDILSNKISFKDIDGREFVRQLKSLRVPNRSDIYIVTAMDAETFGHHIPHWEEDFLAEAFKGIASGTGLPGNLARRPADVEGQPAKNNDAQRSGEDNIVETVTISDLLSLFPRGARVEPKPSSWSTTEADIKDRNFYPLWSGKGNELHGLLWEHLRICQEMVRKAVDVADNPASRQFTSMARTMLDPALHSDQFWWASKRPMWDINMVQRGLNLQRDVLLNGYKGIAESSAEADVKRDYQYKMLAARWVRQKITDLLVADETA